MMIQIGPISRTSDPVPAPDVASSLLECHERIRSFIGLARRLGAAQGAAASEVQDAARRIDRYFSEALPLHVADEEESVLPRLAGVDPALDAALETMRREHGEHTPALRPLLEACRVLAAAPDRLEELREQIQTAVPAIERSLVAHLEAEENIVLPAIRRHLAQDVQAVVLEELRARRRLERR